MQKLFVYGTLKNKKIRKHIFRRDTDAEPATLPNYTKRKGNLYYFVREREGDEVQGLLLTLTNDELEITDRYENVPLLYTRKEVNVIVNGKIEKAWTYV